MSATIDQRVVEMRFDNKQFESGAKESISTLSRLKQSLNLTGASKGIENINSAANKVNLSSMGSAVDTVRAKFSALEVMGITALANITNQAVNAGKKMISALTIDPIKTGFQEYETQINAVQTILANTSNKGSTIDDVNKALDELNKYADLTIYNFTEMTRNIGTFTAAGIDLETSVSSIQGIANLAAVSGSTSQQASTAMYQLSQALAAGTVKLMDWNSVVNAGMGGEVFQNALKRTATVMGTNVDALIEKYGSFRESLKEGWITSEVLTKTLEQFTMAAEEGTEQWNEYKKSLMEEGYTEAQANEILRMANTATDAATKVKTFTQLWDVLKESAQSGWSQTWKLLIGDFEEAKSLLTPLADFLTGVINAMSDARNKLLEGALGKSFTGLVDTISKANASVEGAVDTLKDYGEVVDKILGGEFGNGQKRWDALTEAGYDWAHAQNLVNEKLGDGTKHATDYKESQDKLNESGTKLEKTQQRSIEQLVELSDARLKELGYTDQQIKALRQLQEEADKTGIPLKQFIKDIDEINGRYLLINGFKNIGEAVVTVFKAMGKAWRDIFPAPTSDQVYDIIAAFHKFTTYLEINNSTAVKLKQTFRGLFAIIDIFTTLFGGGLKFAFKVVTELLGYFDMDILDVTASIGNVIVKFRNWIDSIVDFKKAFEIIVPLIKSGVEQVQEWKNSFLKLPEVQKTIESIKDAFENLKDIDLSEVGKNIIAGLKNGLSGGVMDVLTAICDLGKSLIAKICEVLGIHSPSTEFYEIGENIIQGLLNGLQNGFSSITEFFKNLAKKCIDLVKNINWGTIFAGGISIGLLATVKKLADAFAAFTAPLSGLGELLGGTGEVLHKSSGKIKKILNNVAKVVKSFANVINSVAFNINADAIKKIAISLAIVIGSVALLAYIINKNEGMVKSMWHAVGVITVLGLILAGLVWAVSKLGDQAIKLEKGAVQIKSVVPKLLGIAVGILILAAVVKIMGSMDPNQMSMGIIGLTSLIGEMILLIAAFGILVKGKTAQNFDKFGGTMLKLSIALLLMVGVVKLIGLLDGAEIAKGLFFIAGFTGFIALLSTISMIPGKGIEKLGGLMIKISIALMLMVAVVKLAGTLEWSEMGKGALFALGFLGFIAILVSVTKITKEQEIAKLGGLLLSVSAAMLIMVAVCKLVGKLTISDMIKGALFVGAFLVFLALVMSITKIAPGQQIAKVGLTLLSLSASIAILAGVCILLGMIDVKILAKGVVIVGLLSIFVAGMIVATENAKDCKGSIMAMAVAIAVMAVAVAALSFIDWKNLAPATIAIGSLMGMFALMAKMSGNLEKSMASLIVMDVAIVLLATSLYLLAKLPIESTLGAAAALSMLLLSLSASMVIIGKLGTLSPMAMASLALMTVVVTVLGIILYELAKLPVESTLGVAKGLSMLILSLSAACVLLALAGLGGPAALIGIGSLMAMIVGVGGLIMAIGALVTKFPQLEEFLNKGIPIIEKIGTAIGSFIGNIISSLGEKVGDTLITLGEDIAIFMDKLATASANASKIESGSFDGVKSLIGVISDIALNTVGTTISDIFTFGGTSMEKFEKDGVAFFEAMKAIGEASSGVSINETAMESVIGAAKSLAELQSSLEPIGGVMSWFTGRDDLGTFGVNAGLFIRSMKNAFESLDGAVFNTLAMDAIVSASTSLANLQSSLTPIGGVISWFAGRDDLGTFGVNAALFIDSMVTAFDSLDGLTLNVEAMDIIVSAASSLAELQSSLEPIGGVITWFTGRDDLGTFGVNAGLFIDSMVTAFSSFDGVELNTTAMDIIVSAAKSLAELQSSLEPIGGVMSWFTGRDDLGTFGVNISIFIGSIATAFELLDGVTLDTDAIDSIVSASASLAELQSSLEPIGGVITWFTGRDDLGTFGTNVASFIRSMVTAFKSLNEEGVTFNTEAMNTVVSAATSLAELQSSLESIGGVITWFTGRDDLGTFGTNIDSFIRSMVTAFKSLNEEGVTFNTEAMSSVVSAATKLAELQSTLEPVGGVISWFNGRDDLGTFGTNIGLFADAISALKTGMGEDGISEEVIASVTNAGTAIIELQKALPEEGWFDGKMNLSEFSEYVSDFSTAMSDFSTKATEIDSGAVSSVISTAYRIKSLINSLVDLDTSGLATFTGVGTGGFGADGAAYKIAQAIAAYSDKVAGINIDAVTVSVTAAQKLKSLIAGLVGLDTSGIENFKVKDIGSAIKSYSDSIAEINMEAVSSSITSANRLVSLIKSMVGLDSSGVATFKTAIANLGTVEVNKFINAFKAASVQLKTVGAGMIDALVKGVQSKHPFITSSIIKVINLMIKTITGKNLTFKLYGEKLITFFCAGIINKNELVIESITSPIKTALDTINSYYGSFYNAGAYLVSGFVAGISANMFAAAAQAAAMAKAAVAAAEAALGINSPSKVFYGIGKHTVSGFVNALGDYGSKVYKAGSDMADRAKNGFSNAINNIRNAIENGIDTQPTIRPVLDLSDVSNGVGEISGLLNMNPTVGMMSNVSAISSGMNRLQNGRNDDIVSSINKLRKDLSNVGNTYYTIDGVTYDDGSNVSNAVEELVRAARVERRV